ncbi:MAG: 5-dehydro-4-deoxy-D-glucuronate isomerase [Oscillospiraceae bacterium]|nr:5-dehydro-4-deoxy-D-glucuronate isomerase [Oscillospiraceae bacterium]
MELRTAASPKDVKHYDTDRLREEFLIDDLFKPDEIKTLYSHIDRIIVGSAVPVSNALTLTAGEEIRAAYFLERREMGIINVGGKGVVTIDGKDYALDFKDGIYIGMGAKDISFKSDAKDNPSKFYFNSAPAHKAYPIKLVRKDDILPENKVELGTGEACNERVINKYIVPGQVDSCQLVMGITSLKPGSVWNTMPWHTHDRRMEVYLYFEVPDDAVVFHYMGEPNETRHIIMRNQEAVISPSWSVHSASATKCYSFIWGMVGENQAFDDMDWVPTKDMR